MRGSLKAFDYVQPHAATNAPTGMLGMALFGSREQDAQRMGLGFSMDVELHNLSRDRRDRAGRHRPIECRRPPEVTRNSVSTRRDQATDLVDQIAVVVVRGELVEH